MRNVVLAVVVAAMVMVVAGSAFAFDPKPYGDAGCGLGGMVIGEESGPIQLVATFLNGLCGNQTFGISSGTLGCGEPKSSGHKKRASNELMKEFVVANMDNLAKDIAQGKGETLDTFAEIMEVPVSDRLALYQKLQANFSFIFPSEKVVLADVVDNIALVAVN
jgi:hypothetical protein